jgi:hypothetical protein
MEDDFDDFEDRFFKKINQEKGFVKEDSDELIPCSDREFSNQRVKVY